MQQLPQHRIGDLRHFQVFSPKSFLYCLLCFHIQERDFLHRIEQETGAETEDGLAFQTEGNEGNGKLLQFPHAGEGGGGRDGRGTTGRRGREQEKQNNQLLNFIHLWLKISLQLKMRRLEVRQLFILPLDLF